MYHGHVPLRSFSDVLSHSPLTGKAQFLGPVTVIKSFKLRLRSQRHQLLPSSCLRNRERRFFHVPSVLYPPVTFLGLAALLWSYKCLVMVIFQNKIIYMPSVPHSRDPRTLRTTRHYVCLLSGVKDICSRGMGRSLDMQLVNSQVRRPLGIFRSR